MWSIADPHQVPDSVNRITPSKILYYFDGPQIFTARFGFLDAIFAKFDEYEGNDLWLAAFTDEKAVNLLVSNKLSVRGIFLNGQCWVIQASPALIIQRFWACAHDDLSDDMLPDSGVALSDGVGRRPDSVEQAQAFFSIGFKGDELKREEIKFSSFQTLMNNAYEMARRVLAPPDLLRSRRSTFDFNIFEPKLGSLIVSIKEPLMNIDRIAYLQRDQEPSRASINGEIRANRQEFFEDVYELIGASSGEEANFEVVSGKMSTLTSLSRVLPSRFGLVQSVEFSASFEDGTASIYLDGDTGHKLASAYRRSLDETVTEAGVIQITNNPSKTFTILTNDSRQITCQVGWREYAELLANIYYKAGGWAVVTGPVLRRPRRDMLWVAGIPTVQETRPLADGTIIPS